MRSHNGYVRKGRRRLRPDVIAVVIAVAATTMVSCGGGGKTVNGVIATPPVGMSELPVDALKRQLGYVSEGRWDAEWEELYPAEQGIASEDLFINCRMGKPYPEIDSVNVIGTYDTVVPVPGDGQVAAKTLPANIVARPVGASTPEKISDTFYEIAVDGDWRWLLKPQELDAYKMGVCPPETASG